MSVDPVVVSLGLVVVAVSLVGLVVPVRAHDWWYHVHPMYETVPTLTDVGVRTIRAAWAVGVFLGAGLVILGLQ